MNPNWITHGNLDPAARTVGDSLVAALYLQWVIGYFGNWNDVARGQQPGEPAPNFASVTKDGDVIVVPHFLCLGAANYQVVQRVIDHFGDKVGLFLSCVTAERVGHRSGLVDQKNDASGVC